MSRSVDEIYDINMFIDGGEDAVITGGLTKYKNDHSKPAIKDATIEKLLPAEVPECLGSVVTGHCISATTLKKIGALIHNGEGREILGNDDGVGKPPTIMHENVKIVELAKKKLDCDTEMCILEKLEPQLGRAVVTAEISTNFKIKGPTDNKLLSNINIDNVMNRYSELFPGFYPYNFNMRNYASYRFRKGYVENIPDTLATIQFIDLFANGNNCCGCVINDDTYQGPGTHWMALFADARGSKWSVEFFNSSGNAPAPEWVNWMTKTKSQMEDIIDDMAKGRGVNQAPPNPATNVAGVKTREEARKFCCDTAHKVSQRVDIVCCSEIRHQQSKTECGLYSLFYIFARLNGVPYDYFMKNPVPDQLMFEFRQLLFSGEKGLSGGKFNWNQFLGQVSVAWE